MYAVHYRLVSLADELHVPLDIQGKMSGNILLDFIISLFPVLGSIFCWMNACSTRNAAMIDTFLRKRAIQQQRERRDFQLVDERQYKQQQKELEQQRGRQQPQQQQKKQSRRPPQNYQQRKQHSQQQIEQWHQSHQQSQNPAASSAPQWQAPQQSQSSKQKKGHVDQMESGVM